LPTSGATATWTRQLVWRGKDEQDWSDLVTHAPPIYIQEKVHPKVLIDDLLRRSEADQKAAEDQFDLFADFNGVPEGNAKTEFYQHDANWTNRMIFGDSLQVMASLAVCADRCNVFILIRLTGLSSILIFNGLRQVAMRRITAEHITREPEQVKAFRDTWRDGIHSYLTYLRDRLTVARDLLSDSGSIFVQIGDENVHLVRSIMEEVFGIENFCTLLVCRKTSSLNSPVARVNVIPGNADFIGWFCKSREIVKYRQLYFQKSLSGEGGDHYRLVELPDGTTRPITPDEILRPESLPRDAKIVQVDNLISQGYSGPLSQPFEFSGRSFTPGGTSHWKTTSTGLQKLAMTGRRTMGTPLDHYRHIPRCARSRSRTRDGGQVLVLSPRRQQRRPTKRSRSNTINPIGSSNPRQPPPRVRLRTGPARHSKIHRQQR
jgi:adenine-specific DNA-methyltransferase